MKPLAYKIHPLTCKCGLKWGKKRQGQFCKRCKTNVTFKSEHTRGRSK